MALARPPHPPPRRTWLELDVIDADAAKELLNRADEIAEREVRADDDALDLVKLGQVRRVHRLVAGAQPRVSAEQRVGERARTHRKTRSMEKYLRGLKSLASSKSVRDETAVVCVRRMFFCASASDQL